MSKPAPAPAPLSIKLQQGVALAVGIVAGIFLAALWLPAAGWVARPAATTSAKATDSLTATAPSLTQQQPRPTAFLQQSSNNTGAFGESSQPLLSQIHSPDAIQHAAMIWLPTRVVKRLTYSIGHLGMTYRMNAEEAETLGLTDDAKQSLLAATDKLLADLRALEPQHAQYLEQTDETVLIKIPAGFAPQSLWTAYEAQVQQIFGPQRADLFLMEFRTEMLQVTNAFTGSDRRIRVTLQGENQATAEIEQNSGTTGFGGVPDFVKHLIRIDEGKPSK